MKISHPPQVPPNSRSPSLPTATTQGLQTLQGLAPRPGPDLHQPTSGDDHGRWQPSSPPYPPSPAAAPSGAPSGSPPFQSHLRNLPPGSPTDLAIRSALAAGVPHTTLPTSSRVPPIPRSSVLLTCGTGPPGQPLSFLPFLSLTISPTFPDPPRNHLHHPASGRRLPNPTKGGNPEELGVRQQQQPSIWDTPPRISFFEVSENLEQKTGNCTVSYNFRETSRRVRISGNLKF